LYIYRDPVNGQVPCIITDSLRCDASTPVTVEAWALPIPTAKLLSEMGTKSTSLPIFQFYRFNSGSMLGVHWMTYGIDAKDDTWSLSGKHFENGTIKQGTRIAGPAQRGALQHIAMTVEPDGNQRQKINLWINGKMKKSATVEQPLEPTMPLASVGFVSEMRVSKVARYTADFTPQHRFEPDPDTIALYHCDEGSGTQLIDSSSNGHHGKLTFAKWAPVGSPSPGVASVPAPPATSPTGPSPSPAAGDLWIYGDARNNAGPAVVIDGLPIDGSTPTTIECWAMPFETPALPEAMQPKSQSNGMVPLFGFAPPAGAQGMPQFGMRWIANNSTGAPEYWQGTARKLAPGGTTGLASTINVATVKRNIPVHIALVVEPKSTAAQKITPFVDGKPTATNNGDFQYDPVMRLVGEGYFDELRISNTARYSAPFAPARRFEPDANTVALYHCDEGSGTTLVDSSGHNRHGKLTGITWARAGSVTPVAVTSQMVTNTPRASSVAAATPAADLWVYQESDNSPQKLLTVDSVRYSGSTPLTIEAWIVAVLPPSQQSWEGLRVAGRAAKSQPLSIFEFDNVADTAAQARVTWKTNGPIMASNKSMPTKATEKYSYDNNIIGPGSPVGLHHVAMTFGPTVAGKQRVQKWFDGKRVTDGEFVSAHDPLAVLQSDGFISELRVSKGVRYAAEFLPQARFEPDADTIALYHCDEGRGDKLLDSSGNGHHGTLANARWATVPSMGSPPIVASAGPTVASTAFAVDEKPAVARPPVVPAAPLVAQATAPAVTTRPAAAGPDLWIHSMPERNGQTILSVPQLRHDPTKSITVEGWCYAVSPRIVPSVASTQDSEVYFTHFGFGSGLTMDWRYNPAKPQNDLAAMRVKYRQGDGNIGRLASFSTRFPRGEWRHAAMTVEPLAAGRFRIVHWSDGKLIKSEDMEYLPDPAAGFASAGCVDEIRISAGVRYAAAFTPQRYFKPDPATIALYHCDEGSGNQLFDSSGNGLHGQLTNAMWAAVGNASFSPAISRPTTPSAPSPPSTIAPPPVVTPAPMNQAPSVARQKVPAAKDQAATIALIKDVYKDDFTAAKAPDKKAPLADKLLQQARTSVDTIEKYVLLNEARTFAVDGDDPLVLKNVLAAIVSDYEVDPTTTMLDGWKAMLTKSRPPALVRVIYDDLDQRFDAAVAAAEFDTAKKYGEFAVTVAPRLADAALGKAIRERNLALVARQTAYAAAKAAVEKLATTPDDPEANTIVGRYRADVENDWANALPLLAKGNAEPWKSLATKSLAGATDAAARAAIGDAWWDAAQGKPAEKAELTAAAVYWYQAAVGSLTGLNKTRIEKRLTDAAAVLPPRKLPPTMLHVGELATVKAGDNALRGEVPKVFDFGGPKSTPNVPTTRTNR
jgi:hypothetical protein